MELVLDPYPTHSPPRFLEEMAMGKVVLIPASSPFPASLLAPLKATRCKRVAGTRPRYWSRCVRKGLRPTAAWSSPGSGSQQSTL